ncbi:MAG: LysM peptidoglycan-binding domain-containing protein [Anaerolineales bacterium]|nr:LysM peptidoglycan-binding domain-containing protein [Anaerolineales bacterium]
MKNAIHWLTISLLLAACVTAPETVPHTPEAASAGEQFPTPAAAFTPLPTRPPYAPGELVEYTAQTGDTLPALAARFNTTEAEIRAANPVIPQDATTMPPGFPMKIPIYYKALWGTPYQILPDSLFVNGPAQVGFDVAAFVNAQPGWFKAYREQIADGPRSGAELVEIVATNFSISPRLLLALLEYYAGALSKPEPPAETDYLLNYYNPAYRGVYLQLIYTANTLNNGYYAWRRGTLLEFETPDGRLHRPDPWQNAATVAIQYAFSRLHSPPLFDQMIGPGGLAETYARLFGDPWQNVQPHIPGSLKQPFLILPFENGKTWNYTGGPHTGWGKGEPYAAIDFAPTGVSECNATNEWVTAMADGVVARSQHGQIVLDLDGDGDERTGWVLFYLHLATENRPPSGTLLKQGDRLGHASCEGGESTGTHVHIARKYNGEWILADSPIPFDMEGWVVRNGAVPYKGTLTRFSQTVTASSQSEAKSLIKRGE